MHKKGKDKINVALNFQENIIVMAIRTAQALSELGEPNNEYIRGQAELICGLFDLPMESWRDVLIEEISKGRQS